MKTYYSSVQAEHSPEKELFNGAFHPAAETTARLEAMLKVVGQTLKPEPLPNGLLAKVHSPDYAAFLATAHEKWLAAGRTGDAIPYVFPVVGRRKLNLERIDGLLGRYSLDCGTPIGPGTWDAAMGGAEAAFSASKAVASGERSSFALCRPPGHHAGRDYMGGYSYLNNAAIAAETALAGGASRVAILDVDYHHGNGTQDIFYDRGDVLFVSLHATPSTDYPFYWGHADETGEGAGVGANLNIPLPRGTEWESYRAAMAIGLEAVRNFAPDVMIVSYGADTFEEDPISYFKIKTSEYEVMSTDIAALCLPTVICMEGGYAVEHLGANLAAFLAGFD